MNDYDSKAYKEPEGKIQYTRCYNNECGISALEPTEYKEFYCISCFGYGAYDQYIIGCCNDSVCLNDLQEKKIISQDYTVHCCGESEPPLCVIKCHGMKCRNDPNVNFTHKHVHCVDCYDSLSEEQIAEIHNSQEDSN